jgi:hypothetical protein
MPARRLPAALDRVFSCDLRHSFLRIPQLPFVGGIEKTMAAILTGYAAAIAIVFFASRVSRSIDHGRVEYSLSEQHHLYKLEEGEG